MTARLLRTTRLVAVPALVLALPLLAGAPAYAVNVDDGGQSGSGLSVLQTVGLFVGAPAALFAVITLLVLAPSMARGPRYRPGVGWWAAPVWFNGPDDPDSAVRAAVATESGGGASARW